MRITFFFTVLHHIDVVCMQYLPSEVMVEIFDNLLFNVYLLCHGLFFYVFHKLISYFFSCQSVVLIMSPFQCYHA
jgi:hypothetical protein